MTSSTQDFIPIESIENDLVFLKNGGIALVLETSAVNFSLLFETEQIAIIQSFAGLLNSLSFPMQIVIRSKRLDISSYLQTIDKVMKNQTSPLLSALTARYRTFVEALIKENDVLDKHFYVCITVSPLETGILHQSSEEKLKKALFILGPRKDHLIKQLARIGLKTRQLETIELTKLFFDIYNPTADINSFQVQLASQPELPKTIPTQNSLQTPVDTVRPQTPPNPAPPASGYPKPVINFQAPPLKQAPVSQPAPTLAIPAITIPVGQIPTNLAPKNNNFRLPFKVEELNDEPGP